MVVVEGVVVMVVVVAVVLLVVATVVKLGSSLSGLTPKVF